ncbi:MAG: sodium:solute symporter family protein [Deltaproteobacteria bacterium]|nr:sodium:solute symporter family protein [Deltaproteobacteria bacterium]MBN2674649.1 sodium:solute symporter family protein [Deltaproteobacteria bacterium]
MHFIDAAIFVLYLFAMLGVGIYFWKKNRGVSDYYVGGRKMNAGHIGLSVVATDVGGGFSIGLGGLGFTMGLSGSWLLFTGLIGAVVSATLLIPHLRHTERFNKALSFPDLFESHFGRTAALVAAIISALGYLGFTSSQLLAGAKLASATFPAFSPQLTLVIMGIGAVAYTALGGLKAVIYTDTIQWTVLLLGLTFVGIPVCVSSLGGVTAVIDVLPANMFSLTNLKGVTFINWLITIVPIWFVGMTLYQRIFAAADEKTAKRAWYLAGFFEWPVIAFVGVGMGLLAKAAYLKGLLPMAPDQGMPDPEKGLPMMLSTLLPVGAMGVLMSAYFSAILSTADSCLIAASGNVVSDIIAKWKPQISQPQLLRLSQLATLLLGVIAIGLAMSMTSVLDLMLHSYAFMVSGLFVPVLACLFMKRHSQAAAVSAMLVGGSVTIALSSISFSPLGLNANIFGIPASLLTYSAIHIIYLRRKDPVSR